MKTRISSEPTPDEKHRTPSDIFSRFARRSLALNRSRTIVSIIGIALSCALITAIFTSVTTLLGGLYSATLQREGSWQVEVQNISDEALEQLHGDERAHAIYELNHYGSALLPVSFDTWSNRYLNIDGWPTSDSMRGLYPVPELTEGRAPEAENEIVLPSRFKDKLETDTYLSAGEALIPSGKDADAPRATWGDALGLNHTINLAVGKRTWHDSELDRDRPCLDRESLYYEMKSEGLTLTEWVDDVATPQKFTVVGFYVEDDIWMSPSGVLGFVSSETALPVRATDAVLNTNLTSRADIEALIEDYTGVDHGVMSGGWRTGYAEDTIASTHDGLLRYQGMVDDRAIWGTLYTMAAILSGVVIVASVSLIYNAFAISVSERTRQYGLLASLGASQRQIRRTVYAEALMLAVIGIPLGLALGIAGTWIVFQIAGEGIGLLIDSDFYASTHMVALSIEPTILAISAVLALVTVFISAAVPAWRASRISAIDAIRQARDIRTKSRDNVWSSLGQMAPCATPNRRCAHARRHPSIGSVCGCSAFPAGLRTATSPASAAKAALPWHHLPSRSRSLSSQAASPITWRASCRWLIPAAAISAFKAPQRSMTARLPRIYLTLSKQNTTSFPTSRELSRKAIPCMQTFIPRQNQAS